jgi:hypothetical protein
VSRGRDWTAARGEAVTSAGTTCRAPRRHLRASDPAELCRHDHVAWWGDGPEALERIAVSAFSRAAERGEMMVLVSDDPDRVRLAGLTGVEDLIARGALQRLSVADAYGSLPNAAAQLWIFEALLERALAGGHTGITVVADNSSLAAGSEDEFAAWLDWEATADALQAGRPVSGVCYFDRRRVPSERLADLAVMHPVLSADFVAPSFQLFAEGDTVRVEGALDYFCIEQLRRILVAAPPLTRRALDISEVEFIHHGCLYALNALAGEDRPIRLRGAQKIVQRVWALLEVESPALVFC